MAMGKFRGVMMPIMPTGSRVISTPILGRTPGRTSPESRNTSPAKKSKICAARVTSPMPSGSVFLPMAATDCLRIRPCWDDAGVHLTRHHQHFACYVV
jgi:hypothetical protein